MKHRSRLDERRTCERGQAANKEHHGPEDAKDQPSSITAAEKPKSFINRSLAGTSQRKQAR